MIIYVYQKKIIHFISILKDNSYSFTDILFFLQYLDPLLGDQNQLAEQLLHKFSPQEVVH